MPQTTTRYLNRLLESIGITETDCNVINKKRAIQENLTWLINKTSQMFDYKNLPQTLPRIALERLLQLHGSVAIWRVPSQYIPVGFGPSFNGLFASNSAPTQVGDDSIYAFPYNFAEAPDPYGEPHSAIITSPGFRPTISETLEINKDCVIIRNDTCYEGLYHLHLKYARLLTEAEISLQDTLVLLRDQMTFIVKNERQRAAVSAYIQARENGDYASILAPEMGSPLEAIPHDGRNNAVELAVNGIQAIKAAWYNEIGLNPSFSLKREYTSAQEIDSNTDLLLPIIDDMYKQRQIGISNVNTLFGTNISVEKSSAWKVKEDEISTTLELEQLPLIQPSYSSRNTGGDENDNVEEHGDESAGGSDS